MQPNPRTAYRRALMEARARSYSILQSAHMRVRRALTDSLESLLIDYEEGIISYERAQSLRRQVVRALSEFETAFQTAAQEGVDLTLREVAAVHREVNRATMQGAGFTAAEASRILSGFDTVPLRALGVLQSRRENAATFQTMIRRNIVPMVPEVDRFLESALARGVGAGRASLDLARMLAGDAEADLLARLPKSVRSRLHVGAGTINLEKYGLDPSQVKEVRSLLYDARRIQVTETNNAYREATRQSMIESPGVVAARWARSGRHHSACECSILATTDFYGYGPGIYPLEKWPLAPHPHCACSQGDAILRSVREWRNPKPTPRERELDPMQESIYEGWMEKAGWTENKRDRIRANVASLVQA